MNQKTKQALDELERDRMSHTPGPWILTKELDENGEPAFYLRTSDGSEIIAKLDVIKKADAVLMTAAPAMLRLLEDLHDRLSLGHTQPAGLMTVLESVLARAKGKL